MSAGLPARQGRARVIVECLVVAALYAGSGHLGLMAAIPPGHATPLWPPSGIALAAVLLRGTRVWPGIWLGSVLANNWVLLGRAGSPLPGEWLATGGIGIGASLAALLGGELLRRHLPPSGALASVQGVVRFVLLGALLSCAVSATVGNVSLCLGGIDVWSHFGASWLTWWLGDLAGVLVFTPLLLSWSRAPRWRAGPRRVAEAAAFFALLAAAGSVGFLGRYPLAFVTIPVLLWAAFRFRERGVSAAIVVVSGLAIAATVVGHGPFAGPGLGRNESLLLLQAFMGVLVLTTLLLAGLIDEREQAHRELTSYKADLERRVAERTRSLEQANRELEAFDDAVSHDLRTPLAAIDGSVDVLLEAWGDRLDATGRECLERIRSASLRMGEMIRALLDLSLAGRAALQRSRVDLAALAREIRDVLESREPGRQVRFEIPHEMTAEGDERLLRIALENLIANAWKFTSRRDAARIELGQLERAGERVFFVRDDGIGFDMSEADGLFTAFRRLPAATGFPGTGIGLSTVRRIVERHGGRVWVESAAGAGTTLYFTL